MYIRSYTGRPCRTLLDGVKKACVAKSLDLSDENVMCIDIEEWRDFVNCINGLCECIWCDRKCLRHESM